MGALPLSGIKVIDLTQVQLGPCGTQVLGDFGADVIKIERPVKGDLSRALDPFAAEDGGQSAYFMALNRNKRSLAIDITTEIGRQVVLDLVKDADVFVHNFRPGVTKRLGLDYDTLKAINPRLVYASGSGFGSTGPLAHKGGQDMLAQSLSGLAMRNHDDDGIAQLFPTALGDFAGGMILAQGIALALFQRVTTGQGQNVETCLLDTMLAMQQQEVTQWLLRGEEVNWVRHHLIGTFAAKDGVFTLVGVFRDHVLSLVCKAMDMEDLEQRPEFSTALAQKKNRKALWQILGQRFGEFTVEECLRRLDAADILCSEVHTLDEALKQPQVAENRFLHTFDHPTEGKVTTSGSPLRLSSVPDIADRPPPLLGQHNREILEGLGYYGAKIDAALDAGNISRERKTANA